MDILNAFLGIVTVGLFVMNHMLTYEMEKDNFLGPVIRRFMGQDSQLLRWIIFYGLIMVCAICWHIWRRFDHRDFTSAFFCSYYEILGFFALLPQLWMFQKDKIVSQQLGNFVGFTALNRCFTFLFWILFPLVFPRRQLDNRMVQMLSEVLNIAILSDFLFYYIRSKVRGDKEIIIAQEDFV